MPWDEFAARVPPDEPEQQQQHPPSPTYQAPPPPPQMVFKLGRDQVKREQPKLAVNPLFWAALPSFPPQHTGIPLSAGTADGFLARSELHLDKKPRKPLPAALPRPARELHETHLASDVP